MAAQYPVGGVAWDYLQYPIGLARLGHEVVYHEDTWCWPYHPQRRTMTDDETKDVYYVSASQLTQFAGDLFVATEMDAHFWILEPRGDGVRAVAVGSTLGESRHSLEGAIYIG